MFPRALNGRWLGRERRSRASDAIVRTSITAIATAYARDSQATRPPLASTTKVMATTVTSMARAGVPNRVCREARLDGSVPSRRGSMEHLLGVADGGRARPEPGSAPPHRPAPRPCSTRTAAGAARCCARPANGAFAQSGCSFAGTSSRTRNVPSAVTRPANSDGQQAGAPQRLHAWWRQLVGRARQCVAAADDRQRQSRSREETRAQRRAVPMR